MVSLSYSEAAVEVLDILEYTKKEEVQKIPKKFIEFLEENKSKTYIANLDHKKTIKEMKLKPKTEAILGLIYMKYWANEKEKSEFKKRIRENELRYQEGLREEYSIEKLFKKKTMVESETIEENNLQIVQKESFMKKLLDKIKKIFRR